MILGLVLHYVQYFLKMFCITCCQCNNTLLPQTAEDMSVYLSVCLFVSEQPNSKSYEWIFFKFLSFYVNVSVKQKHILYVFIKIFKCCKKFKFTPGFK